MNNFKEWLSDYLRYFMLGLAALLVIGLAVIGVRVYQGTKGGDEGNAIEILKETKGQETEKLSEAVTESETEEITEGRETESETMPSGSQQPESETMPSGSQQPGTGSSGNVSAGRNGSSETVPTDSPAEPLIETEPPTERETEKPAETEPPVETEYVPVYKTMLGACYIRSGPGYEYEIIGEYSAGTVVEFLEDAGGWYKVQIDGMVGYMGARFFE